MIHNHDRSGWFGASDTHTIMGNWETASFMRWWMVKLGMTERSITTPAMQAGTAYEGRILDALGIRTRDRQIRFRALRLRVNLDGENLQTVTEIKTFRKAPFRVSPAYWEQCQVEMLATGKQCRIAAYQITEAEYENYFLPVDPERITLYPIAFDISWVLEEYLPHLLYLAHCLRRRDTPTCRKFSIFTEKSRAVRLLGWLTKYLCSGPKKNTT